MYVSPVYIKNGDNVEISAYMVNRVTAIIIRNKYNNKYWKLCQKMEKLLRR